MTTFNIGDIVRNNDIDKIGTVHRINTHKHHAVSYVIVYSIDENDYVTNNTDFGYAWGRSLELLSDEEKMLWKLAN